MPERVVFDTNTMISGLLWHGEAYQCLLLARSGVVQTVYCPQMMAELTEKLRDRFRFSENRIRAVVYEVRRFAEPVEISGTLRVVEADPDDDKFLECAVIGKADAIVSGDRHLLDLGSYQSIPILSPSEFIKWVTRRSRPASEQESL